MIPCPASLMWLLDCSSFLATAFGDPPRTRGGDPKGSPIRRLPKIGGRRYSKPRVALAPSPHLLGMSQPRSSWEAHYAFGMSRNSNCSPLRNRTRTESGSRSSSSCHSFRCSYWGDTHFRGGKSLPLGPCTTDATPIPRSSGSTPVRRHSPGGVQNVQDCKPSNF